MNIKELIDTLKGYDEDLPVRFATSPIDTLEVLSIYEEPQTAVWIDLEYENQTHPDS